MWAEGGAARQAGFGRMWVARDRNIYTYPGEPWGFDNGAYSDWRAGRTFDADRFRAVLSKVRRHPAPPYMAILPDVVGKAAESLDLSLAWLDAVPGLPWYLAIQDGMKRHEVEPHMSRVAGLFLGGTNKHKATAGEWCRFAKDHGARFHYGRAGTMRKVEHAVEVEADSLDSAFPMWTEERMEAFCTWIASGVPQLSLGLV